MWLIDLLFVIPTNCKEVVLHLISHYKCDKYMYEGKCFGRNNIPAEASDVGGW